MAKSPKSLSIGIVGAGKIVSRIHLPVLSSCQDVHLSYVADIDADAARVTARSFRTTPVVIRDNPEELPITDVVLLAIPVSARMPYYRLLARRGTCVLAEKPLAGSLADAQYVCELYPEHALGCGFQRRAYATARRARTMIAENWFGPLRSISVAEGALTTKTGADSNFYDADGSGGVLMDLGCHSLDLALYISGAGDFTVNHQRFVFDNAVDREVEAELLLHTSSGSCTLHYMVTWLRPVENTITLRFDNCMARFSTRPAEHIEICSVQAGSRNALLAVAEGATTIYQVFYLEWTSFLAGVRNRQSSEFGAASAVNTLRAVDALYEACRQTL